MGSESRIESVGTVGEPGLVTLERPATGATGGAGLDIAGTAADRRVTMIEAMRGNNSLQRIPVADGRFSGTLDMTGLSDRLRFRIRAHLADGTTRDLAVAVVERTTAVEDPGGAQPLTITSMGRSGSTYLMHVLLGHPAIEGHAEYPYEGRWIAHCLAIRRMVIESSTAFTQYQPTRIPKGAATQALPETAGWGAFGAARDAAADAMARSMIRGPFAADAAFIAEKGAPTAELRELFSAPVEILLVRDPRDVFTSVLAFNRKRGFDDFGRQEVASEEEFVGHFAQRANRFADMVALRSPAGLLVRYEDLVTGTALSESLVEGLGIDLLPGTRRDDSDLLREHRTTPDAAASIGRWRHELDPALGERVDEALAEAAAKLGYG